MPTVCKISTSAYEAVSFKSDVGSQVATVAVNPVFLIGSLVADNNMVSIVVEEAV